MIVKRANHRQDPEQACSESSQLAHGRATDATSTRNLAAEQQRAAYSQTNNIVIMANRGYDVVVDVDQEVSHL